MCKLVFQLNSECSKVWCQVYAGELCWDVGQGRGEIWGLKASQKWCLWRVAFTLSFLHAQPFLHLFLGIREMTGTQLQKCLFSFTSCYPEVPYFTYCYIVWFHSDYFWYRNGLWNPWMHLKKEAQFKADRSVPGCGVVLERVSSKWFPKDKQQDFSYFKMPINIQSHELGAQLRTPYFYPALLPGTTYCFFLVNLCLNNDNSSHRNSSSWTNLVKCTWIGNGGKKRRKNYEVFMSLWLDIHWEIINITNYQAIWI